MSAPADLHALLARLEPLGWEWGGWQPRLRRRLDNGHSQFVEPRDHGEVVVHGSVTHEPEKSFWLVMTLSEVVPFLTKMEET